VDADALGNDRVGHGSGRLRLKADSKPDHSTVVRRRTFGGSPGA
jgi:hypothetical protein